MIVRRSNIIIIIVIVLKTAGRPAVNYRGLDLPCGGGFRNSSIMRDSIPFTCSGETTF